MVTKVMTAKTESAETLRAGVGTFLKKYRESKGMSQRDVANKLGYRNINFMSMMEKGGSALPPNRIMEIVNAYCIPQEVSGGIFSLVYEDLWASVVNCLCAGATPEEAEVIKRVDAKCQKNFANIAADFDK